MPLSSPVWLRTLFRLVPLTLAVALAAPTALAQSLTPVWERTPADARAIAADPDGSRIVVGDGTPDASTLLFLDAATGDTLSTLVTSPEPTAAERFVSPDVLAFAPDGEALYVGHYGRGTSGGGGEHGTGNNAVDVRRWDPDAPDTPTSLEYAFGGAASALATDGTVLLNSPRFLDMPNLFIRDADTRALLYSEQSDETIEDAAFSPDGTTLLTAHSDSNDGLRVRTVGTWTVDTALDVPGGEPCEVAFSPDGSRALISTRDFFGPASLVVYDTADWSIVQAIDVTPETMGSVAEVRGVFSQDGSHVVGVVRDRTSGSNWAARLVAYDATTGALAMNALLTPREPYSQPTPADIQRVPGTDRFAWMGNDRVGVLTLDLSALVSTDAGAERAALALRAAPNPTSGAAEVTFALAEAGDATLTVHDLLGRRLATLASGALAAGEHTAPLDASALPGGVYLLRLETENAVWTRRVTVAR